MIYKIYTEDGLRAELEKCLDCEIGFKEKMELVLLKQALQRFHDHGMTGEDFDNERLHDCIIDIVKDNYDNIPKLINEFNGLVISYINLFDFRQQINSKNINELLDEALDRLKEIADE
jgi:hypothetical protein